MAELTHNSDQSRGSVLIVEDDAPARMILSQVFERLAIPFQIVASGESALSLLEDNPFSIFLIDLGLPGMSGKVLINKINESIADPVIIVQTAMIQPEEIVSIMQMSVFDYLIKPLDLGKLERTIYRALDFSESRAARNKLQNTAEQRISKKLDSTSLRSYRQGIEFTRIGGKLMKMMRKSLTEGMGPGALVSIIEMVLADQKQAGTQSEIDPNLVSMLSQANNKTRALFDSMDQIHQILDSNPDLKCTDFQSIINGFKQLIASLQAKNLSQIERIRSSHSDANDKIDVDISLLNLVIQELIINALKHGERNGFVDVYSYRSDKYFCISIKNCVPSSINSEVNSENVFKPFFRGSDVTHNNDIASEIGIGLGLGLSIAQSIMSKHGGFINFSLGLDHLEVKPRKIALFELYLPILK